MRFIPTLPSVPSLLRPLCDEECPEPHWLDRTATFLGIIVSLIQIIGTVHEVLKDRTVYACPHEASEHERDAPETEDEPEVDDCG